MLKSEARALQMLDDQSPVQARHWWWRRGRTGFVHATRACWRAGNWTTLDRVELSVEEVVRKRACAACFDRVALGVDLSEAMLLVRVENDVARARSLLAQGDPSFMARALDCAARAVEELRRMGLPSLCGAAYRALSEEAAAALRESSCEMGGVRDTVVRRAALSFLAVESARGASDPDRRDWHSGGASAEQVRRFGESRRGLAHAHDAWVNAVLNGRSLEDAFVVAVSLGESLATFEFLHQLEGIVVECAEPSDVLEVAQAAWSARVREDLVGLARLWQERYEFNMSLQDAVTVGVEYDWSGRVVDPEVTATLRAFPHAQGPTGFVGNYPEVVWLWLRGVRAGAGVSCSERVASSPAVLEVAAALWEHSSAPSGAGSRAVYGDVSCAVDAALALA